MKKISVIVPTCNDEAYLEECIKSILNQTMDFKNIQLILIDDNSKDKTYNISLKYQEKFPNNIIARKLDENSGSGGKPRNIGINLATGKYLMFSDADDFYAEDAFQKMFDKIEETNADFVISNWNYANIDGTPWKKPVFSSSKFKDFKLSINDYDKSVFIMNSSMCNKIFNRDFIINNNIRCLEGIPGEDTYFSMSAFLNAKNVYYMHHITYYYRQRSANVKESSTSWNGSKKFFEDMNVAYRKLYEVFLNSNEINFYKFIYARNMIYLLYRFIDSTVLSKEERISVLKQLSWFFKLSKSLNIKQTQKTVEVLLRKIVEEKYEDAIELCQIVAEVRNYLSAEKKNDMAKSYDKIYDNIKNNL